MPYGNLHLDVPGMTLTDHVAVLLLVLAGIVAAWALYRQGLVAGATGMVGLALAAAAALHRFWRNRAPFRLQRTTDGSMQLICRDFATAVSASVEAPTRLLGGSVYLDFAYHVAGRRVRCRRWITRFDAPASTLRRWTVVLPRAGRVAAS